VLGDNGMPDKKRSREIIRSIRLILMMEWDPIGVRDVPEAADEYDSYAGGICGLLQRGASEADLYAHLRDVEVDRMGLVNATGQPLFPEARRREVASSLSKLRRYFMEPSSEQIGNL
jgi:hypothetical protein